MIRTSCMAAEQRVLQRRNQWCPETEQKSFFRTLSRPRLESGWLYPAAVSLVEYDIMPYLDGRISKIIRDFRLEMESAVSLWRRSLLVMIREDAETVKTSVLRTLDEQKRAVELARATLQGQYQAHWQTVCPET